MDILHFKNHFYQGLDFINLNNSGQCLIPDVNRDLANLWHQRHYQEGALCAMEGWAQTDVTRERLAHFLGAEKAETAFFSTTAAAISQAALGIPFQEGDEILTWDQEYPSNFYPWRLAAERSRAKLIQISSEENYSTPTQKILDRVNKKTKAVAVSWVQFTAGALTDLQKISKELQGSGIWLVADIIQGAGVRPFHFHESGFDIVCGGSHKYMCSGYGAAYMLVKKQKIQELQPLHVGAMTYGIPETPNSPNLQPKTDGFRFEPGTKAMVEIIAMGATLELFQKTGIQEIYREASRLALRLATGLRESRFEVIHTEGPIVNFHSADLGKMEKVIQSLQDSKVAFVKRGPGIRLSAHAYNTDEQIDKVLNLIT